MPARRGASEPSKRFHRLGSSACGVFPLHCCGLVLCSSTVYIIWMLLPVGHNLAFVATAPLPSRPRSRKRESPRSATAGLSLFIVRLVGKTTGNIRGTTCDKKCPANTHEHRQKPLNDVDLFGKYSILVTPDRAFSKYRKSIS